MAAIAPWEFEAYVVDSPIARFWSTGLRRNMGDKSTVLELAAFLDSEPAAILDARDECRRVVQAFLGACREDLGKDPQRLDGQDMEAILKELLPARLRHRDPAAANTPAILRAYLDHLETTRVVTQAFELRHALEESLGAFERAVASPEIARRAPAAAAPVVHGAPKLGRNDPCSCGSGKKYKKCHGKPR